MTRDQSASGAKPRRVVLLVDDYSLGRRLATLKLRQAGFDVRDASSAEEALEAIRREPPDAIVSDVHMTGMTGLELCEAVRADAALAHIPLVLLSSAMSESEQDRARSIGVKCVFRTADMRDAIAALQSMLAPE